VLAFREGGHNLQKTQVPRLAEALRRRLRAEAEERRSRSCSDEHVHGNRVPDVAAHIDGWAEIVNGLPGEVVAFGQRRLAEVGNGPGRV